MPSKKELNRRRKAEKARAEAERARGTDVLVWRHEQSGEVFLGPEAPHGFAQVGVLRLVWPSGGGPQIVDQEDRSRLPPGIAWADTSKHVSLSAFDWRPVYADVTQPCPDCRAPFTFSVAEQRHWYEVLQIPIQVRARECRDCRRAARQAKAAHQDMGVATAQLRATPADPAAGLAVADATLALRQAGGGGDLARAVGLARRAVRDPSLAAEAAEVLAGLEALRQG